MSAATLARRALRIRIWAPETGTVSTLVEPPPTLPIPIEDLLRGGIPAQPRTEHPAPPVPAPVLVQPEAARARPALLPRFLADFAKGLTLVVLLHVFVIQVSVVRGHSMEPSIHDGDRLVVDRVAYALGEVERFDVVVLRYPLDPTVDFVKRVVGVPGDRVAIRRGRVFVNGQQAADEAFSIRDLHTLGEVVVPEQCYFVLGDNRPISSDSREFGLVPADHIKGKVRACFWPFDRFNLF